MLSSTVPSWTMCHPRVLFDKGRKETEKERKGSRTSWVLPHSPVTKEVMGDGTSLQYVQGCAYVGTCVYTCVGADRVAETSTEGPGRGCTRNLGTLSRVSPGLLRTHGQTLTTRVLSDKAGSGLLGCGSTHKTLGGLSQVPLRNHRNL